MKTIVKFSLMSGICIILSSCVATGLNLTNYTNIDANNTNVVLNSNNYKIVGQVSGSYNSFYVFGIGGLTRRALRDNARAEMYRNAKLKDGQAIINVSTTMSVRQIVWCVYMQHTAVCTGTIIEFTDGNRIPKQENDTTQVQQDQIIKQEKEIIIPFGDKNFKKYVLKNFDKNKDGEISVTEASAVKKIDCRNWNIVNLSGIEIFINLKELVAYGNKFTDVDLSNNTKLKSVKIFSKFLQDVFVSKKPNSIDVPDSMITIK